jgi:hypothetical protein
VHEYVSIRYSFEANNAVAKLSANRTAAA